jgi:hypothetical protein
MTAAEGLNHNPTLYCVALNVKQYSIGSSIIQTAVMLGKQQRNGLLRFRKLIRMAWDAPTLEAGEL